jgi:hypothetical protein
MEIKLVPPVRVEDNVSITFTMSDFRKFWMALPLSATGGATSEESRFYDHFYQQMENFADDLEELS